MTYNIGIIGLGMIGESMLKAFNLHQKFEVACCWDLDPAVCDHILTTLPDTPIVGSAEAVLDDPQLDAIYIATPPVTHIPYGYQVIERGKALFMEKPLSFDLDEGCQLVEAAEAKGIPTAMNFVYGAGPILDKLDEVIAEGRLGALKSIEVRYQFPSWPLPNQLSAAKWITNRNTGGMVREMLSHDVYLMQRALGPLEVRSVVLQHPDEKDACETFALARLDCGNLPVWFMGGVGSPGTPRISDWTLNGAEKSLRFGEGGKLLETVNGAWVEIPLPPSPTLAEARLDQFAERIAGKENRLPTLRDGLEVQKIIEKMMSTAQGE